MKCSIQLRMKKGCEVSQWFSIGVTLSSWAHEPLPTTLLITVPWRVQLASHGWRPHMLLSVLQRTTGQSATAERTNDDPIPPTGRPRVQSHYHDKLTQSRVSTNPLYSPFTSRNFNITTYVWSSLATSKRLHWQNQRQVLCIWLRMKIWGPQLWLPQRLWQGGWKHTPGWLYQWRGQKQRSTCNKE